MNALLHSELLVSFCNAASGGRHETFAQLVLLCMCWVLWLPWALCYEMFNAGELHCWLISA